MMSKFFIEHPVLANVLAIVLVLIGAVCAVPPAGRAISEYRAADRAGDTRLSRAPARRPSSTRSRCRSSCRSTASIGMLYMQSTSAYDGTYNLTVTFEIGTDPNIDQVLVQNRVQNAHGPAAAGGAGARRQRPDEITVDPAVRDA